MKQYNFDLEIDRYGTGALKTDALQERYGDASLIPLWVADMDFPTPDFIIDALRERLEHPILGYTMEPADYRPAIIDWNRSMHGWELQPEWISYIPGIVKGIGMVLNAFGHPGDKVIIFPPVYHPFRIVPELNGFEVVNCGLKERADGYYDIDFGLLESLADDNCRFLILSNPHNPVGITWDKATLQRLAEFCRHKGIIVISDEIHSEMAIFGHRHIPFATVSKDAAACSITFAAPSKTFNIAGVVASYSVVPDEKLREKFYGWLTANELGDAPIFSHIATIAAYRHGDAWRRQMLAYIEDNIRFVEEYMAEHIKDIKVVRPQASFLVWLDCRDLGLSQRELVELFVEKAGLALNDGSMFGPGGEGFMRLNVGTTRATLRKALERLRVCLVLTHS